MLFMIGGAPRSGKTILAQRMLADYGLPYFPVDALIASLASAEPALGLRVSDPALKRTEVIWPILRKLISDASHSGDELVLEGDVLLPKHVMEFGQGSHPGIKACFIGYADVDPAKKLRAIRQYAAGRTDWTHEIDDVRLLNLIGELRTFSEYLRYECCHYKIPYFDGSRCFARALHDAEAYLQPSARLDHPHAQQVLQSSLSLPQWDSVVSPPASGFAPLRCRRKESMWRSDTSL